MNGKIAAILILAVLMINSYQIANANENTTVNEIKQDITKLNEHKDNKNYDVEQAVAKLYEKISDLEAKLEVEVDLATKDKDAKITDLQTKLDNITKEKQSVKEYLNNLKQNPPENKVNELPKLTYDAPKQTTKDYVILPPNSSRANNYIQDGKNAQGYARMVFSYGPEQVYKIYCKIGYLTDIKFKDNEKITYVGGGDTAQWLIDHATVENTSHLYVKPIANNISTNVIVNTDTGHIYQILLNSGDWFNPMVSWSYGNEDDIQKQIKQSMDNAYIEKDNIKPENINFNYKIKGNKNIDFMPTAVFNDKRKTYIKFKELETLPVLFIKDKDKKLILANYKTSNNTFIVETIFDEAILKSANEEVTITRKD